MKASEQTDLVDVELSVEQRALILALSSHAVTGALDALREGGYQASRDDLERVVKAIRSQELAQAVLVLERDDAVSNEQLIEAARLTGAAAVREALGPAPMAQ